MFVCLRCLGLQRFCGLWRGCCCLLPHLLALLYGCCLRVVLRRPPAPGKGAKARIVA